MYPECRHVKSSGRLCDSPALGGSHWCFFHKRLHERQIALQRTQVEAVDGSDSSSRPEQSAAEGSSVSLQTIDHSAHPVTGASQNTSLDLPPLEDAASIQLALIEVAQALAANRIDTKRAGLLLYALQVASVNVKNNLSDGNVRTVTYTEHGTPLAPQEYGFDLEDFAEYAKENDDK